MEHRKNGLILVCSPHLTAANSSIVYEINGRVDLSNREGNGNAGSAPSQIFRQQECGKQTNYSHSLLTTFLCTPCSISELLNYIHLILSCIET